MHRGVDIENSTDNQLEDVINMAKEKRWTVGIYGLGSIGSYGREILSYFGLKCDFVSDVDLKKLKSLKEEHWVSPTELLQTKEEMLLFVFVGFKLTREIKLMFSAKNNIHLITWVGDLLTNKTVIERFLKIKCLKINKSCYESFGGASNDVFLNGKYRIAVYTCITGNYDRCYLEPKVREECCDYYCITDVIPKDGGNVNYINVYEVVPDCITDAKEQNRYCKMHGNDLFPKYDYSIYIDGNMKIVKQISNLVNHVNEDGFGMFYRNNALGVYDELVHLVATGRINRNDAERVAYELSNDGIPLDTGLPLGGIIVSQINNIKAKAFFEEWWNLYRLGEIKRDMLYLPQMLYRKKIALSYMCSLGPFDMENPEYIELDHVHFGMS